MTRKLRAKDIKIDELVSISNDLIEDKLDIYLPHSNVFVFELVIDRLNDAKLAQFRRSIGIWRLFNKLWKSFDNVKTRSRIFQNLKYGEVLVGALTSCAETGDLLFLLELTENMKLISETSLPNIYDSTIQIFSLYLENVHKLQDLDLVKSLVTEGSRFFSLSISFEKITKKFLNTFSTVAMPWVLSILDKCDSADELHEIIRNLLFAAEHKQYVKFNIDLVLKSEHNTETNLICFYKILLLNLNSTAEDLDLLEQVFNKITAIYPNCSEVLLGHLSKVKRSLSFEFLSALISKEFECGTQNWNLIYSLIQIDIEIGISNSEKILNNLELQSTEETVTISIGKELLNCFIKAREFSRFFEVLIAHLNSHNKSVWCNPKFLEIISNEIVFLPITQLVSLVKNLIADSKHSHIVILQTIIDGIVNNTEYKIQLKPYLKQVFSYKAEHSEEELWRLKYQILSIYEDALTTAELDEIISKSSSSCVLEFQFYTVFRIREFYEFKIDKIAKKFVKFVSGGVANENGNVLRMCFNRWFVLIDTLFPHREMLALTELLFNNNSELILQMMDNNLVFECSRIFKCVFTVIKDKLENTDSSSTICEILIKIPIQCYPKSEFKSNLIDYLSNNLISNEFKDKQLYEQTLLHILEAPTFKSKIETDVNYLLNFSNEEILCKVWSHHFSNKSQDTSGEFIKSSLKVVGDISKENHIKYAFIMLKSGNDGEFLAKEFKKLRKMLLQRIKHLLDSGKSSNGNKAWLLTILIELNLTEVEFNQFKSILIEIGEVFYKSNSLTEMSKLFQLYVKYESYLHLEIVYYECLFINLRGLGIEFTELKSSANETVKKVSLEEDHERFNKSFEFLLKSISSDIENSYLFELLTIYWNNLSKLNSSSSNNFIKSLSLISTNILKLNHFSLKLILNELKSLLVNKTWLMNQYAVELIISIVSQISENFNNYFTKSSLVPAAETIYQLLTLTISNFLLHHRFRLSNRHHLIISSFISLMKLLTKNSTNILNSSIKSCQCYNRILSNLCEPSSLNKDTESLTTASSVIKKNLRRYIYVLLLSYVKFNLVYSFNSSLKQELSLGVYKIFDLLSQNELTLISISLDYSGRIYYKNLYDDYKKIGKWQTN